LYLLKELKKCKKIRLAKLLFLIEKDSKVPNLCSFYSFLPYKYGPCSFEVFHDIDNFEKDRYISQTDTTITYENKRIDIPTELKISIDKIISNYGKMRDNNLINHVYKNYPEYTVFSEIKKERNYLRDKTGIYTIGYQGRSIDQFLHILIKEKINTLVDIRYNPWSMKYGFKKNTLQNLCNKLRIEYQHIPDLGIPGNLREKLETDKDYKNLFERYKIHLENHQKHIDFLKEQSKKKRLALMCFEEDPKYCHRHILGSYLQNSDVMVSIA
jgi:uncharacterized protein (DUF488 family)